MQSMLVSGADAASSTSQARTTSLTVENIPIQLVDQGAGTCPPSEARAKRARAPASGRPDGSVTSPVIRMPRDRRTVGSEASVASHMTRTFPGYAKGNSISRHSAA